MPELGESVTEGTVTRWLKKVGDSVEVDEPLVEVSTDKVDTEIPSPVAGTLISITAEEDATVAGRRRAGAHRRRRRRRRARAPAAPAPPRPRPTPAATGARRPGATRAADRSRPPRRSPSPRPSRTQPAADRTQPQPAGRRHSIRDAAGAKTGRREQHRPELGDGHRGGRSHPQAGRAGRRRTEARSNGRDRAAPRPRPPKRPPPPSRAPPHPGSRAGGPAGHHPEGQPDPPDHREQNPRIPSGHRPAHPDPRGRHDPDRCVALPGPSWRSPSAKA